MEQKDIRQLLERYRAGTCTPEELVLLLTWLDRLPEDNALPPDADQMREQVKNHVWQHIGKAPPQSRTRQLRYRLMVAAAIGIPLLAAMLRWLQPAPAGRAGMAWVEHRSAHGEIKKVILPDSSLAWLHAGASIAYPAVFTANRTVKTSGQVFFEVAADPAHPFRVQSGPLLIQVLGTSFLVKHIPGHPVSVAVASGRVKVNRGRDTTITLRPAEQLSFAHDSATALRSHTDTAALRSWINGDVMLNDATLATVLWELSTTHQVRFRTASPQLLQDRLNLHFSPQMTLQDKLQIITTISVSPKIHFRQHNDGMFEIY